ncbi:uncharacterized protein [Coffea arabica]|uniref:Uncharacterized protein n=1 Tax=Coffea arabica TaxID=13443 RepID=A0A6P6VUV6_COFAR|nr:uncharacterized protein LOC113727076 isoform X3 [Coffea arabica]
MALVYNLPQSFPWNPSRIQKMRTSSGSYISHRQPQKLQKVICAKERKRCLSLGKSKATVLGERGLFAFAPPHQGIDGEWSDKSGVIVYRWNEKDNRPNTGISNWKKRWSCCAEYDENAPPCRQGWHVSYDDGFTLY